MALTAVAPGRPVRAAVKIRPNVMHMAPEQLERFRNALRTMMDRPDDRGYDFFAGWHGVPLALCKHADAPELFLPWHRGYLYHIELGLQDIDADVTLPWWNWMDEPSIPEAYAKKTVNRRKNPLYQAKISPLGVQRRPEWPTVTNRNLGGVPDRQGQLPLPPPFRQSHWNWLMVEPTTYAEFARRCQMIHNNVHRWVSGTMGSQNWAAWDPIFWAHHTMVDRLWSMWQTTHPGAEPPADVVGRSMTFGKPPSLSTRQVLDVGSLGYDYAGLVASVGF